MLTARVETRVKLWQTHCIQPKGYFQVPGMASSGFVAFSRLSSSRKVLLLHVKGQKLEKFHFVEFDFILSNLLTYFYLKWLVLS